MEAQCQCGNIKFTTPLATPLKMYACHCHECRHQSSSAFGMTARFPYFEIIGPTPDSIGIYSRPNSSGQTECLFCTHCGARLAHRRRSTDGKLGDLISVKAGCLTALDKELVKKAVHIFTRSAVVDIPEGAEAYENGPPSV